MIDKILKQIEVTLEDVNSIPKVRVEEVKVIGSNKNYFVVDDHFFSKYCHKKEKYAGYSTLNEVNISDYTRDSSMKRIMGQFRIYLISDMSLKRIENKINREFNKYIQDKVGEYGAATSIKISLGDVT